MRGEGDFWRSIWSRQTSSEKLGAVIYIVVIYVYMLNVHIDRHPRPLATMISPPSSVCPSPLHLRSVFRCLQYDHCRIGFNSKIFLSIIYWFTMPCLYITYSNLHNIYCIDINIHILTYNKYALSPVPIIEPESN